MKPKARKAAVASNHPVPPSLRRNRTNVPAGETVDLDLVPGVRDRLLDRLIAMGLPADKRISHVAALTQRATQTVRRWFDAKEPGLPDLESFARLCIGLSCCANEALGLTHADDGVALCHQDELLQVATCVRAMTESLVHRGGVGVPMRVPGDEMEPKLHEGDLVLVDRSVDRLAGNGIYALECDGRMIIRRLEHRPGRGMVIKCDNKSYGDMEVKNASAARRLGIKVAGRVSGAIALRLF